MQVSTILALIDMGSLTLPRFQRGYVWSRSDVSKLMRSLYRGYPVGSLLVWETQASRQDIRGEGPVASGTHKLLLDGQQRVTSLYGIINDKLPGFSDGNPQSFRNLYFNVQDEIFEFYGPTKMKSNPHWISVTDLMQRGIGPYFARFAGEPDSETYVNRLLTITNIKNHTFYVETVSGADKDTGTVVDIFNQVNSGGTKLSKGDLALAKICADWPEARDEMQQRLDKWSAAGYSYFRLDNLLRWINAVVAGQSDFAELDKNDITTADIKDGLARVEKHIDRALNLIASRLGLDDGYVLGSPNALAAIVRYFDKSASQPDPGVLDGLLYWYVHAMLWQRYSGPVETVIRQDLLAVDENQDAVAALIDRLELNRRHLRVTGQDFAASNRGGRFYSLLYMLTRVYGSRDFASGVQLRMHLLGKLSRLELHHIFPKSQLKKHGYTDSREINAQANFTFLTKETNLQISARLPVDYLPDYESKHPGVLASHWIPMDPELWRIENYRDFLAARRELLADAANSFLDQLRHGSIPESQAVEEVVSAESRPRPMSVASDDEEAALVETMEWMAQKGLPQGELGYELVGDNISQATILDLAWPRGIQTGLSKPVALLIDESRDTLESAQRQFSCYTSVDELKAYVEREIIGQ